MLSNNKVNVKRNKKQARKKERLNLGMKSKKQEFKEVIKKGERLRKQ